MFRYIADCRRLWAEGTRLKAEAIRAQHLAAMAGATIVPAGHALVRPAGLVTEIDQVPFMIDPNKRHAAAASPTPETSEPNVDLVAAMQYPGRAYGVIGPQQSGKSWVARHALSRAAHNGHRIIVIGPKIPTHEWGTHCEIYGPEWEDVVAGLRLIGRLARDRREEATRRQIPTQSFEPIYVAIDDWTETVSMLGDEASKLLTSATTMFASCRIIPTFILHANTTRSWGNAVGKCLTENFLRVRVIAGSRDGIPDPSQSRYGVLMPGEEERKVEHEIALPRYGFLPSGAPSWPRENGRETERETGSKRGYSPVVEADFREFPGQFPAGLPASHPRKIRVRTARGWREIPVELTPRDNALARRAYERRGQIRDVVAAMKVKGHNKLKYELAKALVGLPSNDYEIIEG